MHLLDREGGIVAQRDSEPQGGMKSTSRWEKGEEVMDRYGVMTPEGLPEGEYKIVVGIYDPESGRGCPL